MQVFSFWAGEALPQTLDQKLDPWTTLGIMWWHCKKWKQQNV